MTDVLVRERRALVGHGIRQSEQHQRSLDGHRSGAGPPGRLVRGATFAPGLGIGAVAEVAILLLVVIVSAWRFRGANSVRPDELDGIHVDVTNFRRSGDAVSAAGRPTAEANSSHRSSAPDLHLPRVLPDDAMFTVMSFLRVHGGGFRKSSPTSARRSARLQTASECTR